MYREGKVKMINDIYAHAHAHAHTQK